MPPRCSLCGATGAACGTPTRTRVMPVDARITGFRVAGDTLVPDLTSIAPTDMTDEEREEYIVVAQQYERRRNRLKVRQVAMAEGKAPHTSLTYVMGADGITRKMHPDLAKAYVDMNPGSEIVREGALPVAKEGEVIGATKATVGQMFNEDGRQIEDVQPMTTRTFLASDRTRQEAVNPALGTTGAASEDVNTGTGSLTNSATSAPKMTRPRAGQTQPVNEAETPAGESTE